MSLFNLHTKFTGDSFQDASRMETQPRKLQQSSLRPQLKNRPHASNTALVNGTNRAFPLLGNHQLDLERQKEILQKNSSDMTTHTFGTSSRSSHSDSLYHSQYDKQLAGIQIPPPAVCRERSMHINHDNNSICSDVDEDRLKETPSIPMPCQTFPRFDAGFPFHNSGNISKFSVDTDTDTDTDTQAEETPLNEKAQDSGCVLVNRRKSKYTISEEAEARKIGKKRLRITRNIFLIFFVAINAALIFISWKYPEYWYVFVPIILLTNILNSLMVLNILRWFLWNKLRIMLGLAKPTPPPATHIPTTIAMVLACYCESREEMTATLDSLAEQDGIDHHKKMFIIICDGQVKGKGMEKSTDRVLVEDIFDPTEEKWFPIGYESWDGAINGLLCSAGTYHGIPYVCLVKTRNLGKRDGLILVRTLLYKYSQRDQNGISSMGNEFFQWFCHFSEVFGIESFDWLVGVDADTTFNRRCIYEMHKACMRDPKLIGCSGLIKVGFRTGNWNLYNIYQNTEYIRAQCLRRWHQAHGTGKVSCLPGACQILRICEESCGDRILIELFGHIPDPKDNMIEQVRALAGEDRNYICLIFFQFPQVQTTMALNAIAYTDPPNGAMVFLSQRKRWTLSTCANDVLIFAKNEMNWFERICSFADVLVWALPWFIMQTFILFVMACVHAKNPTFIVCFAIVTMIPTSYSLIVTIWGCTGTRDRCQFLLGLLLVMILSQFITPCVISYAIWHMDDFSWGKTREIVDDGTEASKPAHS